MGTAVLKTHWCAGRSQRALTGQLFTQLARKCSRTLTPTLKYRQMSYHYKFLYLLPRFKTETKAWQSTPRDAGLYGALLEPKQADLSLSHFSDGLREKEASVLNHRLTRRKWALFSLYCRTHSSASLRRGRLGCWLLFLCL